MRSFPLILLTLLATALAAAAPADAAKRKSSKLKPVILGQEPSDPTQAVEGGV